MSFALTENSNLVCAHQGTIKLTASQSKLTVSGANVLVDGDLAQAPVSLCQTPPSPVSSKCLKVVSAIGGVAVKLKVQGKGVLLDNIQGVTDGVVPNGTPQPWSVQSAGETKLKAV
jgi:hypothetical protein